MIKKKMIKQGEFVARSLKHHMPTQFDYSWLKDEFGYWDKIPIGCDEHGLFLQKAGDHMKGHGCQKCGYQIAKIKREEKKTSSTTREQQIREDYKYWIGGNAKTIKEMIKEIDDEAERLVKVNSFLERYGK